jgi:hypothetical protein
MVYINFPRQWNTGTAYQGESAGEEVLMYNGSTCSDFSTANERDRCLRSAANESCVTKFPDATSAEYKQCFSDTVLGYPLYDSSSANIGYPNRIRPEMIILIACMAFLVLIVVWRVM